MLERMWRKGTLVHHWWECKLVQPLWKTEWRFLKKLKIQPPYDPVISLLGIHPKNLKSIIQRDLCTPMFIAALFTIAKTWKQPKYISMAEWIKKMWYIYTMEYYSAIKKDKIIPFATTWMDFEDMMSSKISWTEKDQYCMISLTCESKTQNKHAKQNKNKLIDIEKRLVVTRGGGD